MIHQMFKVKGMTCDSCVEKISDILKTDGQIVNLHVMLNPPQIHFDSDEKIDAEKINQKLAPLKKYSVEVDQNPGALSQERVSAKFLKYMPLILLFGLSAGIPAIHVLMSHSNFEQWMYQFMGVTLIALAYFKLLDLSKFAEAFSTYDPIAMKFHKYGNIYPFFELIAGTGFVLGVAVKALSILVILFLLPTTVGVVKALKQKRKFQCACLGTAFNLPLTKVTIVENILMITMSALIIF